MGSRAAAGRLLCMNNSATARPRAVLYVRLSKESAASTSILGQNDDLVTLAQREGWDVVRVFEDNGKSGGKERANAQAAFDLWRAGDADILAVYAYDRWSRMGIKTLAALIEVVDERKRTDRPAVFIAAREGIESTQPDWELRAAFAADMAKRERDLVAARQTAARDRMRRQGRNAGHGIPPFGYRTGPHPSLTVGRGLHVIPEERAVVLEVAERILRNESLVKIAASLTERGIPTARSEARRAALAGQPTEGLDTGRWTLGRIRSTWTSDHLLGRISHKRSPLYDETGAPLAPFEPILSLDVALAIRARFEPAKRGEQPLRRASALLSGLAYCSGCDGKLYPRTTGRGGYLNYACSAASSGRSCPKPVSLSARKLEREVVARYLAAVATTPEFDLIESFDDAGTIAELAEVEARLRELNARALEADDDEEDRIRDLMAPLKARRRALREVAPVRVAHLVPTGRTMAEAWAAATTDDERRRLLNMTLDHVFVYPATSDRRVSINWHAPILEEV